MLLIARETESSVLIFTFIWFTIMVEPRVAQGWIHTLLEEAENERMHLMTFLELRRYIRYPPTAAILLSNVLSPVFARRFLIDRFLWAWIIQMY